ncbi:hypothetical protein C8_146 [Cannes 8 virus]|nr:hypothetical protein C8_146 [Cannes 8 virus]
MGACKAPHSTLQIVLPKNNKKDFYSKMSLEQVLDETFQVWLDSFQGEFPEDEEASKIWTGFKYALALVRKEGEKKAEKEYEKAHERYSKPIEKIQKLCEERNYGFFSYQGKVYPCVGVFDPEEWQEEEGEPQIKREILEERRMEKYEGLSSKRKKMVDFVLNGFPFDKVVFWDCEYGRAWFTFDKDCYGYGRGKYFTVEEGKYATGYKKGMNLVFFSHKDEKPLRLWSVEKCIEEIS